MGSKGIVASTAGMARAAAGGHRRHHPRLAHAGAGRRPHAGSAWSRRRSCRPWACARSRRWSTPAPAAAAPPRTFFQELAQRHPGHICAARCRSGASAIAGVETDDGRGDGLRRQRPGRKQARQHRHQPAGHRRAAGGAGLHRRRERPRRSRASASPRSSSSWSRTTSSGPTGAPDARSRTDPGEPPARRRQPSSQRRCTQIQSASQTPSRLTSGQ